MVIKHQFMNYCIRKIGEGFLEHIGVMIAVAMASFIGTFYGGRSASKTVVEEACVPRPLIKLCPLTLSLFPSMLSFLCNLPHSCLWLSMGQFVRAIAPLAFSKQNLETSASLLLVTKSCTKKRTWLQPGCNLATSISLSYEPNL